MGIIDSLSFVKRNQNYCPSGGFAHALYVSSALERLCRSHHDMFQCSLHGTSSYDFEFNSFSVLVGGLEEKSLLWPHS